VIRSARVWQDLRDFSAGSRALVRWLTERDPLEVGLALFGAETPAATRGVPSTYVARIASAGEAPRSVTFLMDFYTLNPAPTTNGHYVYFSRSLRIPPRATTTLEIRYDWERTARFSCEGSSTAPDDFWRGSEGLPRVYAVYAILLDPNGVELDRLVISQELRG
jgi:hypothetical protein